MDHPDETIPFEPITESWLVAAKFRLEDSRNDPRFPVHSLAIGLSGFMKSTDDLCIDVSLSHDGDWHCWVAQREPYRHIHIRMMRYTHEIVRLYEALTGKAWGESC